MKMKKSVFVVLALVISFSLVSCAQQPKTSGSQEAIQQSKDLKDVQAQVKYLINEANGFMNSQKFNDAINTAQYVLSNLDSQSVDAKNIIDTAKAKLKELATQKTKELSDNLQKKIGGLGQ